MSPISVLLLGLFLIITSASNCSFICPVNNVIVQPVVQIINVEGFYKDCTVLRLENGIEYNITNAPTYVKTAITGTVTTTTTISSSLPVITSTSEAFYLHIISNKTTSSIKKRQDASRDPDFLASGGTMSPCDTAAIFTLLNGKLYSNGELVSTTSSAHMLMRDAATMGDISTTFGLADDVLFWSNDKFVDRMAVFCVDGEERLNVYFDADVPVSCSHVTLASMPLSLCTQAIAIASPFSLLDDEYLSTSDMSFGSATSLRSDTTSGVPPSPHVPTQTWSAMANSMYSTTQAPQAGAEATVPMTSVLSISDATTFLPAWDSSATPTNSSSDLFNLSSLGSQTSNPTSHDPFASVPSWPTSVSSSSSSTSTSTTIPAAGPTPCTTAYTNTCRQSTYDLGITTVSSLAACLAYCATFATCLSVQYYAPSGHQCAAIRVSAAVAGAGGCTGYDLYDVQGTCV